MLDFIFGSLSLLSLALVVWQWIAASRFPLHKRQSQPSLQTPMTLLKSLKGCDEHTEACLRSWFEQDYPGALQILMAVASADDPVCDIVRNLLNAFPAVDAELVVCSGPFGPNAKMSKLAEVQRLAKHDLWVISDADVRVPPDLLRELAHQFNVPQTGLVHCFYRLANPTTAAMQWEALAINADFWSQVLQAASLKPVDFALGAVMAVRRSCVESVGGLGSLANCLADDYQLGHRIAKNGSRLEFARLVVECWSPPMNWAEVWKHQLRWARTIRACQPIPYFFSILSNGTLWPLLWLLLRPGAVSLAVGLLCLATRIVASQALQRRLTNSFRLFGWFWMVPLKDILQVFIWVFAFAGSTIEWRGQRMKVNRDGSLRLSRT